MPVEDIQVPPTHYTILLFALGYSYGRHSKERIVLPNVLMKRCRVILNTTVL